nr:extracellular solute-binding protein [Mesorhizobium sp. LMG 17147]
MDIDRALAGLDRIKPHVRKWWTTGSEIQQMMHDKGAGIMQSYDGRALLLVDDGAPIEIKRNQAKLLWSYWVITKGSPNLRDAQKFVEFATRADRQTAFVQLFPAGPSNLNAYKTILDNVARRLASYPDYMTSRFQKMASGTPKLNPTACRMLSGSFSAGMSGYFARPNASISP